LGASEPQGAIPDDQSGPIAQVQEERDGNDGENEESVFPYEVCLVVVHKFHDCIEDWKEMIEVFTDIRA